MPFVGKRKPIKLVIIGITVLALVYTLTSIISGRKVRVKIGSVFDEVSQLNPPGVILESSGPYGDQLFKYAVSFNLAKSLDIPLYLVEGNHSEDADYEIPVKFGSTVEYKSVLRVFHLPFGNWINSESLNLTAQDVWQVECSDVSAIAEIKNHLSSEFLTVSQVCESEEYFKSLASEMKHNFAPRLPWGSKAFVAWKESIDETNVHPNRLAKGVEPRTSVAVLIDTTYRVLPFNYYRRGMHLMENKFNKTREVVFFVFSDDMDYVKANLAIPSGKSSGPAELSFKQENVFLVSGSDVENSSTTFFEDFVLSLLCRNIIISDNSASWWAAYLLVENDNKTVIAPKQRSNNDEGQDNFDTTSVFKEKFPKGWIELDLIE